MSNRFLINLFNLQNKHNHEKKFLSSNHLTIDLFVHLITDPNPSSSVSSEYHSDIPSSSASDNRPENDFSSVSQESHSGKQLFCRITKAAYDKGVAQQVDDDLRSASVSAPKLVKALNTNDALGYTDTKNLNSTDLYNLLNDHYGLPFKPRAFQTARCK